MRAVEPHRATDAPKLSFSFPSDAVSFAGSRSGFLRTGLGGIGRDAYEDRLGNWAVVRFEYASVGLPAMDALPYIQSTNPLGIALAVLP